MKYIFDFDDVLFDNKKFKEHMYATLGDVGISKDTAESYYKDVRENQFSLRSYLNELLKLEPDKEKEVERLYQIIMGESANFLNIKLLNAIKRVGYKNCYIVTTGDHEFQWDKIKRSGTDRFFPINNIKVVPDSKREAVKEIIDENGGQEVVFFDDKPEFFEDLGDLHNLTTVTYTEKAREYLEKYQDKFSPPELKRRK